MNRIKWRRKSDGVIVTTGPWDWSREALATREDNGHVYWTSWATLGRKYERIEDAS